MNIEKLIPRAADDTRDGRDLADKTLKKLAMNSYLEARQRANLRTDIAVAQSDRVHYWQIGKSKLIQGRCRAGGTRLVPFCRKDQSA